MEYLSETMMKTDIKEMELQVWEEIVGECVKFEVKGDQVVVTFRCCQNMRIAYQRDSGEGIILREFGKKLVGRKLAILRTDIPSKPIIVRVMPKKNSTR